MTHEAQRIAIAEACGWTVINGILCDPKPEIRNGLQTGDVDINPIADLPDYCNDLDAMHEAEKTLRDDDEGIGSRWAFIQELIELTGAESMEAHREVFIVAHATAAQRAEAFLRTLNLWTD